MTNSPDRNRTPEISVVVPTRDRPTRLLWLLNALEEQTLERDRWEVIVAHDSSGPETEALLQAHPLATAGLLRHVSHPHATVTAAGNRNSAWRLARAPLIAFTDDDCRPPPDWLEQALGAARRNPGAIVQGRTEPDPDEWRSTTAPHFLSQNIVDPPSGFAETCNIVYPRQLLEDMDGFNPELSVGEDTDLALRAHHARTPLVAAREVRTYHAVHELTLVARLRSSWRWESLPLLVKLHPASRSDFPGRYFWKRTHIWFPLAAASILLARRRPALVLLTVPWALSGWPDHGRGARGMLRSVSELPGRFAIDLSEFIALVVGSIRHRSFLI